MLRKSVSYPPTHEKIFLPLIVYTNIYVGTWYLNYKVIVYCHYIFIYMYPRVYKRILIYTYNIMMRKIYCFPCYILYMCQLISYSRK